MKASSLPNLNRETTSITHFFTLFQDPNHHDDTTLNKRPKIDHSVDTEASETSPFKDILSPFVSFNEMNENHFPIDGSFYEWEQMGRTLPSWPPSPTGSDTNVSVGSNQFSGNIELRSEGPKFTQLRWDQTLPNTSSVGSNQRSGNVGAPPEGPNFTQLRWDRGNYLDFPKDEFRHAFKMSKSMFNLICTQLKSIVDEKDMMLQLALPSPPAISQRVAVCMWHLATGEPLHLVSKRFGLDTFTCHKFLLEVCYAINDVLMIKYVNWPDEAKMKGIKSEFESRSRIPNVGGSMYTTHVPISAPQVNGHAYINKSHTERNQKTSYTVTIQGVVDSKGIFTDVCIGGPGSMTDEKILETSEISLRANQGLLKDVWIVGGSGYLLRDWLLVPYTEQYLWLDTVFNGRVGRVQRVAKEAFRRLKGRWRCLQEITEVKLQDLPVVLGACCVLHNICEMSNEPMDPVDAIFEIFDDEIVPENRESYVASMQARDKIASHLFKPANKRVHSLEQLNARLE